MTDLEKMLEYLTPTTLVEMAVDLFDASHDDPNVAKMYAAVLSQGKALIGIEFAEMMIQYDETI